MLLPDKCLYHPDGGDIFLYAGVQVIVPAEHFPENLKRYYHDSSDHDHQEDHRDQEHSAQVGADDQAHGETEDQVQRRPHRHTDHHHKRVLHVGNICGHTGHQTWHAEFVNIGKGKGLDIGVDGLP